MDTSKTHEEPHCRTKRLTCLTCAVSDGVSLLSRCMKFNTFPIQNIVI